MRKYSNFYIIGLVLIVFGFSSCYEQEVSDPISPDGYPVATFTTDFTGTEITEGDTIIYVITLDKMLDFDLTFDVKFDSLTEADDHDIMYTMPTIAAYSTEAEMMIVVLNDGLPENSERLKIEIGDFYVGTRYELNPNTVNPVLDLKVVNNYDPMSLVVSFGWGNDHNDIDIFTTSADYGAWSAAASSDNPEIMTVSQIDHPDYGPDPDGVYYVGVDPYYVEDASFVYDLRVGHPDGEVEFFTGVFDMAMLDSYTYDYFDAWDMNVARVMSVTKTGDSYAVEHVLPQ